MLVVDGEGAQALEPDLVLKVRAARTRDDGDRVRPAGVDRVLRARGVEHLERARIGRVRDGRAELAVVHEVHQAQVGHLGHRHPHDLAQHRPGLGRRLQQLAGPRDELRAPPRGALVDERLLVAAAGDGGEHGEPAAGRDRHHLADVRGREEAVVREPQRERARHGQHGHAERAARRGAHGRHQRPDDQQQHEHRAVAERECERRVDSYNGRAGSGCDARRSPHRCRS